MAYRIRVTLDIDWVGDGVGSSFLGINQSNDPGYTSTLAAGMVGVAQTLEMMVSELVPGSDTPTQGNFNTALTNAATDLGTMMGTAGAANGDPRTPFAIVSTWSTGGP